MKNIFCVFVLGMIAFFTSLAHAQQKRVEVYQDVQVCKEHANAIGARVQKTGETITRTEIEKIYVRPSKEIEKYE